MSTLNTTLTGPVNEGTVTFTILDGTNQVGTPAVASVSASAAAAVYVLPAGTPAGSYIIHAVYSGSNNFNGSSGDSSLIVAAAASATAVATASATFNGAAQNITLHGTLTGPVNEGTVTFTIFSGTFALVGPITVSLSAGAGIAICPLPAGIPAGSYIIEAVYSGTNNFGGSSGFGTLIIAAAASATAVATASATFNGAAQNIGLNTTITSPAGSVNDGTVTFTILNGTIVIGTPVTVNVSASAAAAVYLLPAGTPAGSYIIQAIYNGSNNFVGSSGNGSLIVSAAASATAVASASAVFNARGRELYTQWHRYQPPPAWSMRERRRLRFSMAQSSSARR